MPKGLKINSSAMSVLSFEHVHVSQDGLPTLQDISMHLQAGDFVYLIGKTGSGKSTFFVNSGRNTF
jgi:cell division transport system ATP-binding protein